MESVHDFCLDNNFKTCFGKPNRYIKSISGREWIVVEIYKDSLKVGIEKYNVDGYLSGISYYEIVSIDYMRELIQSNKLYEYLENTIIKTITKLYKKFIFSNKDINPIYEFNKQANEIYNKLIEDENNRNS